MSPATLLLSTAYFPPISYVAAISGVNHVLIEAHETYSKQSYRNRCRIYSPNGLQALSVPVVKPFGNRTKTHEVLMDTHSNWKTIHWRSIVTAYNSSPFFLYYKDYIFKVFNEPTEKLLLFNTELLRLVLQLIGVESSIHLTDSYNKFPKPIDLRNTFHPKIANQIACSHKPYIQVFDSKYGFMPDLSILDLLFNEGPATLDSLRSLAMPFCTKIL